MSVLLDLIRREEEEIGKTFGETLKRYQCRAFGEAEAGQCRAILQAVFPWWTRGDESTVRAWAERLGAEAQQSGLPYGQVLAGLSCLEKAVRYHVFKHLNQKRDLLQALRQLDDVTDLLRRLYAEAHFDAGQESRGLRHAFAPLAEEASEFICLATLQGKPFFLNRRARQVLGLEDDELEISFPSLHHYYTPDSWKAFCEVAVPAVKAGGSWEGRSRLRHQKTGEPIEVRTKVFLVRGPQEHRPTCLAIVHRWEAAAPAQSAAPKQWPAESEGRLRAILESSLDPIITINHEGVITEFNRAAEQVFGRRREEVLGTQPSEVLFPASKSAGQRDRIERYLESGEGSMIGKRVEVTAVRASGEAFPAEMAMTLNQERGMPVLTFFVRDISLKKRTEEEQARYSAELERSNKELEQFAYVASHDLQEPLRKIRTFGDRLASKYAEQLDEEGHECIQRMQAAATRMQTLINGLLTLSRVTTHAQDFVPVDLQQVAREVVSDLEVQIGAARGRVEVGKLPTIKADPLQMRQLLQNLIGNAIKFRRPEEPPVVQVHGRFVKGRQRRSPDDLPEDELCRIVVEDNGIGFDEKYAERIFGVFQRLHPREAYEGTGVGLAICRKIVERHAGQITAHSAPGQGARFEVVLPVAPRSQEK